MASSVSCCITLPATRYFLLLPQSPSRVAILSEFFHLHQLDVFLLYYVFSLSHMQSLFFTQPRPIKAGESPGARARFATMLEFHSSSLCGGGIQHASTHSSGMAESKVNGATTSGCQWQSLTIAMWLGPQCTLLEGPRA